MIPVYGPWAVEFALEVAGAALYLRRSKLLSAYFAVTALMDALTFAVFQYCSRDVYSWSAWASRGIRNLILIWLACSICGMFVAEKRKSFATISAAFVSLGSAAIITAVAASGETLKEKLLDAEIAASMILLVMIFLGWIGRQSRLDQAWKWIAAGFMVLVGSDLLFTGLWMFWDGARHWYPLGAIAALMVWVCGPIKMWRIEKKVQEQIDFGRFLVAEDRHPVDKAEEMRMM